MTFIVILAIVTGMFIGFQRGFLRSVFKLIATVLSVVLSYVLAPLIAGWVIAHTMWDDNLQKKLMTEFEQAARQRIQSELEDSTSQYGIPVTDEMINAALETQLNSEQQLEMLSGLDVPQSVKDSLIENGIQSSSSMAARAFYEYIAGCIAKMVVLGAVYIGTFIFISIVLFLLYWIISLALQMNALGGVNRVAGALFGGAQVLIYIWVFFIIIHYSSETAVGSFLLKQIQDNVLMSFIDTHNLLEPIANKIVTIKL